MPSYCEQHNEPSDSTKGGKFLDFLPDKIIKNCRAGKLAFMKRTKPLGILNIEGMDKIMETRDSIGIKLFVLAAL